MKFCNKLQKIRKENNITQEGLADRLNVSRQAVSKWESGSAYPDTDKLIQISKIFNISLDELINDNKDSYEKINKKINFMEIFDKSLEFISKSVNMFCSMKFKEKIKCIFEMVILFLIILVVSLFSTSIISNLIRNIFVFLPSQFVYIMCNIIDTLLYIAWIILGVVIILKIFKNRYLDYYVFICDDSVSEKRVEEPIKELKDRKECKIVIRDPNDGSLNIFKKLGNIFTWLFKCLCVIFAVPLILLFISFVIILVVSLFYILDGIFFNGISVAIIGILLFIYLMIEFIYNLIFNRLHVINRMFIIFIISIILIGIGFGLSFMAITSFEYKDNYVVDKHIIEMSDDLVIPYGIEYLDSDKLVIDDSLDNIKLEIKTDLDTEVYIYSYLSNYYDGDEIDSYKKILINTDYNEIDVYNRIINNLKNKEIPNLNYGWYEISRVYISSENLTKIKNNNDKYLY